MITSGPSRSDGADAIQFVLDAEQRWSDACLALQLATLSPERFGGAMIEGGPGPARDRLLEYQHTLTDPAAPRVVAPSSITDDRLEGGIDIMDVLTTGKRVETEGLLSRATGGTIVVRAAEGLRPSVVQSFARTLDRQYSEKAVQAIFLDESGGEAAILQPLRERVAFHLCTDGIPLGIFEEFETEGIGTERAKALLTKFEASEDLARSICTACATFGVSSLRAHLFTVEAARAIAALRGGLDVTQEDVETAARLVLVPRVTQLPESGPDHSPPTEQPSEASDSSAGTDEGSEAGDLPDDGRPSDEQQTDQGFDEDTLVEAIRSGAVSLAAIKSERRARTKSTRSSGEGAAAKTSFDGRPLGSEPGDPRRGRRLDVLATLRAAVPWQRLRPPPVGESLLRIYPSDLRVVRYANKVGTSVIFVVDASGSNAMNRLAEAKGAVEALLSECYSRRDLVSLIICRGKEAELLLPPSRSLTRARRAIAALPGGGGTPLASAMALGLQTAIAEGEEGRTPMVVFLSDGKANIALNGEPGRGGALEDAKQVAARLHVAGVDTVFFDTSPRTEARAQQLCHRMNGRYVHLPYADHRVLSAVVNEERATLQKAGRR